MNKNEMHLRDNLDLLTVHADHLVKQRKIINIKTNKRFTIYLSK